MKTSMFKHNERSSSSRDRRYECTSIVASEMSRVSCQESFQAGALGQNVGKNNNNHTLERPSKIKKNPHRHHRCFLSSVDRPVKSSTSGVAAGTQAVTAPGAFAFRGSKTVTLAPSYVWIPLLFDHVVFHFEFV